MNEVAAPATAPAEPVTIVTQTRVLPGEEALFARWQEGTSAVVASFPGFLSQTVLPPSPPAQVDWVILQKFGSAGEATAWLHSPQRRERVEGIQPALVGRDDVHIVKGGSSGVVPAPVSLVVSTRIKPGREAAYRAWEQEMAAAQARAPGFQGYRFDPPVPGVQEDWLAILRFDTDEHLQAWLASPARQALLDKAKDFTAEVHTRVARTGFEQWFDLPGASGAAAPAWKQNMLVLLMLYPVVFLFGLLVQGPVLMRGMGLSFPVALFVGNLASVLLLNRLVPLASRPFGWWLQPAGPQPRRIDAMGAGVLVLAYALLIALFSALS